MPYTLLRQSFLFSFAFYLLLAFEAKMLLFSLLMAGCAVLTGNLAVLAGALSQLKMGNQRQKVEWKPGVGNSDRSF